MSSESSDDAPGIVGKVLLLVFSLAVLEPLGMLLYLTLFSPAALDSLVEGGISPGEVVPFLLASPDRLIVAGGIAVLSLLFAWKATLGGGSQPLGAGGAGGGL